MSLTQQIKDNLGSDDDSYTGSEDESELDQLLRQTCLKGLHYPRRRTNSRNRRSRALREYSLVYGEGRRNSQRHDLKNDHNLVLHSFAKNTDIETIPALRKKISI